MSKTVKILLGVLLGLWACMGLWWAGVHQAGQVALGTATVILGAAPVAIAGLILYLLFRSLKRRILR